VFSDDLDEMYVQAKKLAQLGPNVYVKIPVTNTKSEFTGRIIKKLSAEGVKLNVTAVFTTRQVVDIWNNIHWDTPAIISVFAGRIADTGVDPIPFMKDCVAMIKIRNTIFHERNRINSGISYSAGEYRNDCRSIPMNIVPNIYNLSSSKNCSNV
jgi:transaldolase